MKKRTFCCLLAAGFLSSVHAAPIQDAESASHSENASLQEQTGTYAFPDCEVVQFKLAVLSSYSYLLVSGSEALLVDPGRDLAPYRAYLQKHKLHLAGVFLTHSHADFAAGHTEALKQPGLPVYISYAAHAEYPHKALKDGETLKFGKVEIKFLETPGHTLDGMCAVVYSGGQPQMMFSGDTLFVGSVGRPDLMGGTISASALAEKSYDSWHNKLSKLPDGLKFFPAHGAGSLCGAHLRDDPFSTIGRERRDNPYFQARNRNEFIAMVLEGLSSAPQYFPYDAALNRKGPPAVDWNAAPVLEKPSADLTDAKRFYLLDLRDAKRYSAGHIPNSINIGLRGRMETWTGILIPPDANLILVGDTPDELAEGVRRLHNIGYTAKGILYPEWEKTSLPVRKSGLISPDELSKALASAEAPLLVDVRQPNEWAAFRIGYVVNLPLQRMPKGIDKLQKEDTIVTVCNSAYRSSMAIGMFERDGFTDLSSLSGGMENWIESGKPVTRTGTPPAENKKSIPEPRALPLPDRIGVAELLAMLKDLEGSFELADLRNESDFADFSIPGAVRVSPGDLIFGEKWKKGKIPLILVDRDGTIAMAVGGILAKESERPIKVLRGGMENYWQWMKKGSSSPQKAVPVKQEEKSPPPPSEKKPAAKRSAGC